jgi:hypothetical protein
MFRVAGLVFRVRFLQKHYRWNKLFIHILVKFFNNLSFMINTFYAVNNPIHEIYLINLNIVDRWVRPV